MMMRWTKSISFNIYTRIEFGLSNCRAVPSIWEPRTSPTATPGSINILALLFGLCVFNINKFLYRNSWCASSFIIHLFIYSFIFYILFVWFDNGRDHQYIQTKMSRINREGRKETETLNLHTTPNSIYSHIICSSFVPIFRRRSSS